VAVSARDTATGLQQKITATSTTGLTEDELRAMTERAADDQLEAKSEEQLSSAVKEVRALIEEVEKLAGQVREAVAGSGFGLDAVTKSERTVEAAKKALQSAVPAQILESKDALDATVQMFRSVVQRVGRRG